jgi:hypothetical protein
MAPSSISTVRSSLSAASRSASRLAWLLRRARSQLALEPGPLAVELDDTHALFVEQRSRTVARGAHALGLGGVLGAVATPALGTAGGASAGDAGLGLGDARLGCGEGCVEGIDRGVQGLDARTGVAEAVVDVAEGG